MTSDTASSSRPAARGGLFDATFYQAWALDADGGWTYLPVDAAPEDWRDRARDGGLRCPYPDCGAVFSTVRRGAGRVAFVHPKTGGTHSDKQAKETLWTLAALATLRRWAAAAYPDATVTAGATTDVRLTLADGSTVAIECRYAALSADEWAKRHQTYQEQGVTDIWLFGHAGPYARKAAAGSDLLRPPKPLADLIGADTTAGWLNPFLGLLGLPEPAEGGVAARVITVDEWRPPVIRAANSDDDTTPRPVADEPAEEPAAEAEPAGPARAEPVPAAAETEPAADTGQASETAPAAETGQPSEDSEAVSEEAETAGPAPVAAEEPTDAEPAEAAKVLSAEQHPAAEAAGTEGAGPEATPATPMAGMLRDRQHQLQGWLRKMIGKLRRPAA